MTDSRSAYDEQLPWLEAVDDEDGPSGIPARRMLGALLFVLLAAALVWATFFWLGRRTGDPADGLVELIRAEPGPYKIRPPDPGGLDVTGESETAFQTSAGQDTDAQLDLSAAPGIAVAAPTKTSEVSKPAEPPKPAETNKPVQAEAPPAPPTGGKGSVVQLGAFANRAQAERAWSALAARFPSVAAMNKMIVPFSGGIRLRASASSPSEARGACQTLKVAGENCFVAN